MTKILRAVRLSFVLSCSLLVLVGCGSGPATSASLPPLSDSPIGGTVVSGKQPIVGAHVYLLAANTTGYGAASLSLLDAAYTGHSDSVGAYVLTGSDGSFSITGDYSCTSGQQLYFYMLGGEAGTGDNSAAGELAILGACSALGTTLSNIVINEVTTIAAAYAFAGFATDAVHVSSSGTTQALLGVANAFANAANLASLSSGTALAVNLAGNGTVPQATINTLANILAACVSSAGAESTACATFFANAGSSSTRPTDTASAAIDIAHAPGANVAELYTLQASSSPFLPALTAVPNDFSIGINITGGAIDYPKSIAIDATGDVWITSEFSTSVTELSSLGVFLSGSDGYPAGLVNPFGMAIDLEGNAWVTNYSSRLGAAGNVVELSSSGTIISNPPYTGGGMHMPGSIAIDGYGNAWMTNFIAVITELNSSGLATAANGYTGGGLEELAGIIAADSSNNIWIVNSNTTTIIKMSSNGTILSGTNGFQGIGSIGLAIDRAGNAWTTAGHDILELSSSGSILGTYTGGGLDFAYFVAIDGDDNVWIADATVPGSVSEFSNSGVALSGPTGYTGGDMYGSCAISIDPSGDAWVLNYNTNNITELVGIAAPVVTPLVAGVKNNTLGTRP